jgi:hypothetical protein
MTKQERKSVWEEVSPGLYKYNCDKDIQKYSVSISTGKNAKTNEIQPGLYEIILDS